MIPRSGRRPRRPENRLARTRSSCRAHRLPLLDLSSSDTSLSLRDPSSPAIASLIVLVPLAPELRAGGTIAVVRRRVNAEL